MNLIQDPWVTATAIPLGGCSIIALAIIIERCWFLHSQKTLTTAQRQLLFSQLDNGDLQSAEAFVAHQQPFFIQSFQQLFTWRDSDKTLRDEAVSVILEESIRHLKAKLSVIVIIASLAPMLGLLGTVIGLMRSFHDIGLSTGPVEPAVVANGLWQALTTTAAGMIIAVVCVIFLALFRSKVNRCIADASDVLNRFSLQLSRQGAIAGNHND